MNSWDVLLMAYGSPDGMGEVEAYYTHIRGGRKPPAERVAELRERYRRIGGSSPLLEITRRQAAGLQRLLVEFGAPVRVYVGMKHSRPLIADTMAEMAADGVQAVVGIALAPHYSRLSIGRYCSAAANAAAVHGIALRCVQSWHDDPGLIQAVAARVRDAQRSFAGPAGVPVVFTAHSLPQRILQWSDPYPDELARTSALVAASAEVAQWTLAYQSASATGEPWLGPDVLDALRALHAAGHREVIVCPVGFVADHLEVLYDIDIEAQELAGALGLRLVRTRSLNDAPDFLPVLAALARSHAPSGVG